MSTPPSLEYRAVAGYLLSVRFHERVRGPLRIDAHTWWTTGIDTDRGWRDEDVSGTAIGDRLCGGGACGDVA